MPGLPYFFFPAKACRYLLAYALLLLPVPEKIYRTLPYYELSSFTQEHSLAYVGAYNER